MSIQVLQPEVAAKIAAGEVVERPASAVKELVENAIDAGASEIRVEIREGGKRLIRIVDNGCGIPADQALLAFARHSTSKLSALEDLDHLQTLGFRGEALASIAAVSQMTMMTCARGEALGTLLRLEGGQLVRQEPHGGLAGTTLMVENLFYNTPARRKFLRAEATEHGVIAEMLTNYALAYPEIRFTLLNNDRLVLQTTGTGQLRDVLIKAYGLQVAQEMLLLEVEGDGLTLSGAISPPTRHAADRRGIVLFVNRRWIQDRSLSYAIEEAYHDLLPSGRHPLAVLNLRLDPAEVDVNIHPTKREVRFHESRALFAGVQRAVRHTLQGQFPVLSARLPATPLPTAWAEERPLPATPMFPVSSGEGGPRVDEVPPPAGLAPAPTVGRLPMLRVVGQLAQTYIVAEGPGGMYLVDQHAAHERVVYERFLAERSAAQIVTQPLLEPVVVELSPRQAQLLEAHWGELPALGFEVEPFGVNAYRLLAVPAPLAQGRTGESGAALIEMLDLAQSSERPWNEEALITVVCHSAVRAGQTLSLAEMRDLLQQLEATSAPHSCPHGRPTMIHLSAAQLAREFGRR